MFPHDIVANAPRIISDLRTFFPPQAGHVPGRADGEARLGHARRWSASRSGSSSRSPATSRSSACSRSRCPTEDDALIVLQVELRRRDRVRQEARSGSSPRCSSRASLFMTIEGEMGAAGRVRRRRQLRAERRRLPPAVLAAAAAVPEPEAGSRSASSSTTARGSERRGLLRGHDATPSQFGARASSCSSASSSFNVQGHLGFDALFQFSPFYFIVEISASLSVKVVRRRRCSASRCELRSRARRRGASRAPARSRCCSGTSTSTSTTPGARPATPTLAAHRRCCRCSPPSSARRRAGRRGCRPALEPARLAARPAGVRGRAVAAPGRHAPRDPARGAARPRARQGRRSKAASDVAAASRSRRRRAAGWPSAATRSSRSRPRSSRTLDDADEAVAPGVRAPSTAGSSCPSTARATRSARHGPRASCATRRSSSTRTTAASPRRFVSFVGRAVRPLPRRRRGRAVAAVSQATRAELRPVRRRDRGARRDATRSRSTADNTSPRARRVFPSQAGARDVPGEPVAADPNLASALHVIPTFELAAA